MKRRGGHINGHNQQHPGVMEAAIKELETLQKLTSGTIDVSKQDSRDTRALVPLSPLILTRWVEYNCDFLQSHSSSLDYISTVTNISVYSHQTLTLRQIIRYNDGIWKHFMKFTLTIHRYSSGIVSSFNIIRFLSLFHCILTLELKLELEHLRLAARAWALGPAGSGRSGLSVSSDPRAASSFDSQRLIALSRASILPDNRTSVISLLS